MTRPRLLDLFCGAGGAAMGYHRAGFEVVGVDIEPQPSYPFEFHQADALTYPLETFDAIHASPPCQAYSAAGRIHKNAHPDLIPATRERLNVSGRPWVIENVVGAPLRADLLLCGTMFGLRVRRHRVFEASWPLDSTPPTPCDCRGRVATGELLNPHNTTQRRAYFARHPEEARPGYLRRALGVEWMTDDGGGNRRGTASEAIPPAYTEWIGQQLMEVVLRG